jgi:hypothetical protein
MTTSRPSSRPGRPHRRGGRPAIVAAALSGLDHPRRVSIRGNADGPVGRVSSAGFENSEGEHAELLRLRAVGGGLRAAVP